MHESEIFSEGHSPSRARLVERHIEEVGAPSMGSVRRDVGRLYDRNNLKMNLRIPQTHDYHDEKGQPFYPSVLIAGAEASGP
jgi:hypothetical protein